MTSNLCYTIQYNSTLGLAGLAIMMSFSFSTQYIRSTWTITASQWSNLMKDVALKLGYTEEQTFLHKLESSMQASLTKWGGVNFCIAGHDVLKKLCYVFKKLSNMCEYN